MEYISINERINTAYFLVYNILKMLFKMPQSAALMVWMSSRFLLVKSEALA